MHDKVCPCCKQVIPASQHREVITGEWSKDEEQYLLNNLNLTYKEIAKDLNRSYNSVVNKIVSIKKRNKSNTKIEDAGPILTSKRQEKLSRQYRVNDEDLYYIAEWHGKISSGEIAFSLNVKYTAADIDTMYNDIVKSGKLDSFKDKFWNLDKES